MRAPTDEEWGQHVLAHGISQKTLWASNEALTAENARLKQALKIIAGFPIHSEPLGGAMTMQEIAREALNKL
jgi:hypothetical protein